MSFFSKSILEKWQETSSWLSPSSTSLSTFPGFFSLPASPLHSTITYPSLQLPSFSHVFSFMAVTNILNSSSSPTMPHSTKANGNATTTMSIKKKKVLSDLPDELLSQILLLLPSTHDLHSLCLVSKRMHHVADPVLYKSINFLQPHHHIAFSESLSHRPRRGSLIQNVRLEYPGHELDEWLRLRDGSYRIDNFSDAISRMSNLEVLDVSVPEELLHGIGTLFNGPFDLACLKTCKYEKRLLLSRHISHFSFLLFSHQGL